MKKNILLTLFSVFVVSPAWALSEIEITGELDAAMSVWSLPTGERGNSSFSLPTLFLDMNIPLKESNLLTVTLEGSEEKTSSTERFDVKVREAYMDVVSIFEGLHAARFGLIPDVWQEAHYEVWDYRFLGQNAWSLTEKWKYQNVSDLGFSFMSELPADLGEWAFTVSNGEGAQAKESGPHKEAGLFARLHGSSPWVLSLNYVRGNYDKYGSDVGVKERIQGMLTYESEKSFLVGLEVLGAKDPADALQDLVMVEGINVSALSGESVTGEGGSFFTVINTGETSEIVLRYDYMNAAKGQDGKDLQTVVAGWGFQVSEDIKAAFLADHTRYGGNFATGARDRSKFAFAAQVLF